MAAEIIAQLKTLDSQIAKDVLSSTFRVARKQCLVFWLLSDFTSNSMGIQMFSALLLNDSISPEFKKSDLVVAKLKQIHNNGYNQRIASVFCVYGWLPVNGFNSDIDEIAAIANDDVDELSKLATFPTFIFTPQLLHAAAEAGAIKCFRFLSINKTAYDAMTMDRACAGGNEEIIQMCLENGCTLTQRELESAICNFRFDVISWLTETHNIRPSGQSMFRCLLSGNWITFVHFLNVDLALQMMQNHHSITQMHNKYPLVTLNMLRLVLFDDSSRGNQISPYVIVMHDTLEFLSLVTFDADMVFFAANAGASTILSHLGQTGQVPSTAWNKALIHAASNFKCHSAIKLLIANGADVNTVNSAGATALVLAASSYQMRTMKTLLDSGADVNAKTNNGTTALLAAATASPDDELSFATGWDADSFILDTLGFSMYGTKEPETDPVVILVEAGADVNVVDSDGNTALMHLACRQEVRLDGIKALIEHGADVNAANHDGVTAAMNALKYSPGDSVIQYLIDHGADILAMDHSKNTLLRYAFESYHPLDPTFLSKLYQQIRAKSSNEKTTLGPKQEEG